jgi:hypothetical protein
MRSHVKQLADIDTSNWMSTLENRDTTRLSAITLPGTHDSAALRGSAQPPLGLGIITSKWGECQDLDITGQLQAGIRSLDLRVGAEFKLRHGRMDFDVGHLDDALGAVNAFLDAHAGETVLVEVKWDSQTYFTGEPHPRPPTWAADVERKFCGYAHALLLNGRTPPLLSDVAGKMLLKQLEGGNGLATPGPAAAPPPPPPASSFDDRTILKRPFDFQLGELNPSDLQEPTEKAAQMTRLHTLRNTWLEAKWKLEYIVGRRQQQQQQQQQERPGGGDDECWDWVGLNAYQLSVNDVFGGTTVTPADFAAHVNTKLSGWLDRYVFFSQPVVLGVASMDFAASPPDLVKKLILTNFK